MKARVFGETVGLVPENDQEQHLLKQLFSTGTFAQSFGVHGVGADAETRLTIVCSPKLSTCPECGEEIDTASRPVAACPQRDEPLSGYHGVLYARKGKAPKC